MLTVKIQDATFIVPIGLYDQEQYVHNTIIVNVAVKQKALIDTLPFIDYTVLYNICEKAMLTAPPLLEDVIKIIQINILQQYPHVDEIHIELSKKNPPISGMLKTASVAWDYYKPQ